MKHVRMIPEYKVQLNIPNVLTVGIQSPFI